MADSMASDMKGHDHVQLTVNSGGGDVTEGFAIYNLINDFDGKVDVKVDFAASMASLFIMAADSISMKESSSIMMIHRPWGMTGGNSEDMRRSADTLDKMEGMMSDIYTGRTGIDGAELSAMLDAETYLDAGEAMELGFIDSIEGGKADFAAVAMAGMKARQRVDFDTSKLVAKIDKIKGSKKPIRDAFTGCSTLADAEAVMRQEFKLSRAEATAIVSAVKKIDHGDRDQKEVLGQISNFQFKNI